MEDPRPNAQGWDPTRDDPTGRADDARSRGEDRDPTLAGGYEGRIAIFFKRMKYLRLVFEGIRHSPFSAHTPFTP